MSCQIVLILSVLVLAGILLQECIFQREKKMFSGKAGFVTFDGYLL